MRGNIQGEKDVGWGVKNERSDKRKEEGRGRYGSNNGLNER